MLKSRLVSGRDPEEGNLEDLQEGDKGQGPLAGQEGRGKSRLLAHAPRGQHTHRGGTPPSTSETGRVAPLAGAGISPPPPLGIRPGGPRGGGSSESMAHFMAAV